MQILGITVAHLALTLAVILSSFGDSMARFDHPDAQSASPFIDVLADILPQPAMTLFAAIGPWGLPPAVQWAILAGNSLVWALGLVALARIIREIVLAFSHHRTHDHR